MHLRFILFVVWFVILSLCVHAQAVNSGSARAIAMSEADITGISGWAGLDNPAGLGEYDSYSLNISYQNRYMLPELGTQLICGTIPTAGGTFSPILSYFGSDAYNETRIGLAYGLALNTWLNAGIRLGYHRVDIEATMHQASAVTGDLALIAKPSDGVAIGAFLINPTRTRYNDLSGNLLPGALQLGISYSDESRFCIATSVNWDDFHKVDWKLGSEYEFCKLLRIRAGIRLPERLSYSFGVGMTFGTLCFDLGFEQHPFLGLSSAMALSYKIK
jgi:hypothetical protein